MSLETYYGKSDVDKSGETAALPEAAVAVFGKKVNAVLFETLLGILSFGLICQLTVVWFIQDALGFSLSLWLGVIAAVVYIIHIWWSLGQYLYWGLAGKAARHTALRYIAVAGMLILAALSNMIQLFAVFLGLMGIKAGIFLQPFIKNLRRRGCEK